MSVEVPPQRANTGSSFLKYMPRGVLEIPTVNTAARVTSDGNGRCQGLRAVVGSVSWKPIVLDLETLSGSRLGIEAAREAVKGVHGLAQPMSDVRGSAAYKRAMAVEFAARAVMDAWRRAQR